MVRPHPRSAVTVDLDRTEQVPVADTRRCGTEHSAPSAAPAAKPHDRTVESIGVIDVRGARGGEITFVGEVRSFLELDTADKLGNQEAEIRVAVRMSTGRHIDRHTRNGRREVRAVVQIEAAKVVLVRFALTTVLADDHARHRFEHLARTHHRARADLYRRHRALACS